MLMRLLLAVVYFVVLLPFGIAVRFLSDSLRIRKRPTSWTNKASPVQDLTEGRRQS
jgi:hypothetical protein